MYLRLGTLLLRLGTVPLGFGVLLLGLALELGPSLALVSSWPLFLHTYWGFLVKVQTKEKAYIWRLMITVIDQQVKVYMLEFPLGNFLGQNITYLNVVPTYFK